MQDRLGQPCTWKLRSVASKDWVILPYKKDVHTTCDEIIGNVHVHKRISRCSTLPDVELLYIVRWGCQYVCDQWEGGRRTKIGGAVQRMLA